MDDIDPFDISAGRGSANTGNMEGKKAEFHVRPVDARLAGLVTSVAGYRENGRALSLSPEMAPLVVPLVISFGEPFEIALGREPTAEDAYWSFTSGLYPGFVLINSNGGAECIQIDFTPLGAFRFFNMPMSEISNRMVTLDELGDRQVFGLREHLGEITDWGRRLALVEEFLLARLLASNAGDPAVGYAFDAILRRRGTVRISELARSLEWSRKHLNARFHEEIGVGPKAVARMVRFNRALAMARRGLQGGWAGIAADCGYADQSHLVREFREFAGRPPAAVMANLP